MPEKEKTAPNAPTAIGEEQPSQNNCNNIITETSENFNSGRNILQMVRQAFDPYHINTFTMEELLNTVYAPVTPIIDDLLYPGVYLFVGAPKLGKSFLMAQLAYHVSKGIPLWNYTVHQSTVLYLALEDTYPRLQRRLSRMFDVSGTEKLHFAITSSGIDSGLDKGLEGFVQQYPDTKLIIIDTLQKVRETGGVEYSYANDYQIMSKLKEIADRYGICLLLVHHTRKQRSDDSYDTVSGTNGLFGAADGAFLLQKEKRTANTATLEISGRDQQDQKLHLVRNTEKLYWELDHTETELWKEPPEPILDRIAEFITANNPHWVGTATELIEKIGTDIPVNAITKKLNVNVGRLFNEYGIVYKSSRIHDGRRIELNFGSAL